MRLTLQNGEPVEGILGGWYADPLSPERARELLANTEAERRNRLLRGGDCQLCHLAELVAHFWLDGSRQQGRYEHLKQRLRRNPHGRVLLELLYGQLLLSRRLTGAWQHLDHGFEMARLLFTQGDYFAVLKRHQQLRSLPLGDTPHPAEPLSALLTSARVIDRLQQGTSPPRSYRSSHRDTFD